MSESGLTPGKIQFFSYSVPALDAGSYRLTAQQTVDVSKVRSGQGGPRTYAFTQTLEVRAPRFRFGPGDVHSVYPPPFSEGDFTTTIPHIVLRRRTLPWERTFDGQPQTPDPKPWLALLIIRDSELDDVKLTSGAVKDLMLPAAEPPEISLPQFNLDGPRAAEKALELEQVNQADPQVNTLEIKTSTFQKIAPKLDDLKWLAHVRRVNTGNKELLGLIEDGWFSVVLSNRVPAAGGNTAHLVSIEGCRQLLDPAPSGILTKATMRLVSLASWKFSARSAAGNFREIVNGLDVGLLRVKAPESLRSLAAGNGADSGAAAFVAKALDDGYVPLTYRMRHGEVTAAWYRGPLTPIPPPRTVRDPFPTAEAGLIYDPEKGMFDVSNAIAWQIGRLLALSDARFIAALGEWREQGQAVLDGMIEQAVKDRSRGNDTIWRAIGDIQAELDPTRRGQQLDELLNDPEKLRELLESLRDPNSGMRPITTNVADAYEDKLGNGVQQPQDTKAKLLGNVGAALQAAYEQSNGKFGVSAAVVFRDELLRRVVRPGPIAI